MSEIERTLFVSLEESTIGPLPDFIRFGVRRRRFRLEGAVLGRYLTSKSCRLRFLESAFLGRPRFGGGNNRLIPESAIPTKSVEKISVMSGVISSKSS
jgi:hypothetical protein